MQLEFFLSLELAPMFPQVNSFFLLLNLMKFYDIEDEGIEVK